MKKRPVAAAAMGVSLLLAVGSTAAAKQVTLRLVGHWGGDRLAEINQWLADYERETGGRVKATYEPIASHELFQKILTMAAANASPDVYHVNHSYLRDLAKLQLLQPVPATVLDAMRRFFAPEALNLVYFNGNYWGAPTEYEPYGTIYNKRFLADAGLAEPPARWSWTEFTDYARKLVIRDSEGKLTRAALVWYWSSWHDLLAAFTWSNGGEFFDERTETYRFDEPPGLEAFTFMVGLARDHRVALKDGLITDRTAAMQFAAPWWNTIIMTRLGDDVLADFGSTTLPYGKKGQPATLQYGWGFVVSRDTPNAAEAWDLVMFLTMKQLSEGGTRIGRFYAGGSMPTNPADRQLPVFRRYPSFYKGFGDSMPFARTNPSPGRVAAGVLLPFRNLAWDAIDGKISDAEAIRQMKQFAQNLLGN